MYAFIVRPFGVKNGFDFDGLEKSLIRPALVAAGMNGATTQLIVEQGNIREDLLKDLSRADLVVADVTLHNANVFYELGIRHALRRMRTFLILHKTDDPTPFDLQGERYLVYNKNAPAASVSQLAQALRDTVSSERTDSPIFITLPGLQEPPTDILGGEHPAFRSAVERAKAAADLGSLALMAEESAGVRFEGAGLRLVGEAQFALKDYRGGRKTWSRISELRPGDAHAHQRLATVCQKLGDLDASDQAVSKALEDRSRPAVVAESNALAGSNAKTRWRRDWDGIDALDDRRKAALRSTRLVSAAEHYRRGLLADPLSYYAGINALALTTIRHELARTDRAAFDSGFEDKSQANRSFKEIEQWRRLAAGAVELAFESLAQTATGDEDVWLLLSKAEFELLSGKKPGVVRAAYAKAAEHAKSFHVRSAADQLVLFERLGLFPEAIAEAKAALGAPPASPLPRKLRVVLFAGHRVDQANRPTPRFPASAEARARAAILTAVREESESAKRDGAHVLGIAGGACGSDLLFHAACDELGIPSVLLLPCADAAYVAMSVNDVVNGGEWVRRFHHALDARRTASPFKLPDDTTTRLVKQLGDDDGAPPAWHPNRSANDAFWRRASRWTILSALALDPKPTFLAYWNGQTGDGIGGTADLFGEARRAGMRCVQVDASDLAQGRQADTGA